MIPSLSVCGESALSLVLFYWMRAPAFLFTFQRIDFEADLWWPHFSLDPAFLAEEGSGICDSWLYEPIIVCVLPEPV